MGVRTEPSRRITDQCVFGLDGGGLDLGAVEHTRDETIYVAMNRTSGAMFRKLVVDFRTAKTATFRIGTRSFSAPVSQPVEVNNGMLACQRSLLGMIIGEFE